MSSFILAIDQGTTSSRAIIFDDHQNIVATSQREFTQYFPASGWVEHDVEEIWQTTIETSKEAINKAGIKASDIASLGITNQRETTIIWDKLTGTPIHNAIVWQDRRTAEYCDRLKREGHETRITQKTGLLLDPYFSATKLRWLLDNVAGARRRAENGDLLFGTVDCYLLWKLTGGKSHKTDATNASRTLLFNIHNQEWDKDLCTLFDIPQNMLPEVEDCAADFGQTIYPLFDATILINGIAGDQHAATLGQACFEPGMIKSTYGTGCFVMMNTGQRAVQSKNKMLTTVGYRLDNKTTYAIEGSIFIAGAAVQWLRDGIKIIDNAAQSGERAKEADRDQDLILVPAFSGLGAPYWEPEARGAIFGLTRNSGPNEFAKATLQSVCYQTHDLLRAIADDFEFDVTQNGLRVDGGMVASDWTMQNLADILGCKIYRPEITETTAMGAAWLAGMYSGVWPDQEGFAKSWKLEREFLPTLDMTTRDKMYQNWNSAVAATIRQSKGVR